MVILASVFAVLAALLHVLFFAYESLLFERPEVHARFRTRTQDVPAVKPWAYNQGFYNLFLAIGALVGVVLALAGRRRSASRSSCWRAGRCSRPPSCSSRRTAPWPAPR